MYLSLSSSGPVKWNHNQESSLLQDVSPFSPLYDGGRSTVTLNERTRELYLQFLWLPEVRVLFPFHFFARTRPPPFFFQLRLVGDAIESIREYGSAAREASFSDDRLAR